MFCNDNTVVVCTLWKLWKRMMKSYMFRDIPNEMKTSEGKTVSESEINERETFTYW
jgi:hypothetical protein